MAGLRVCMLSVAVVVSACVSLVCVCVPACVCVCWVFAFHSFRVVFDASLNAQRNKHA
jgi:hypothetical protein